MTKRSFTKRLLSLLLALVLVLPLNVYAAPQDAGSGESAGVTWEKVDNDTIKGRQKGHEYKDADLSSEAVDNSNVRVSIIVDGEATMEAGYEAKGIGTNSSAQQYRGSVLAQQNALAEKISAEALGGAKLDVVWNITLIDNIISANVPAIKIDAIKKVKGVQDVVVERQYEPDATVEANDPNMSNASGMTGVQPLWASGYTGAGSIVAIIDTGLDTDHQSFDAEAFEYAIAQTGKDVDLLTESEVAAVWDQLNISKVLSTGAADSYLTSKVPFAANYVDRDLDVTHDNDKEGEHGSHVAGIAAANRYVKIGGEFTNAFESVYTQGDAPDAQLLVMKVFGKGGGAYDSDYMVAIEDAIVMGADSVNLSLGSSEAGFPIDTTYADILDSLTESSSVVVISAGNSGSWADETGIGYLYSDGANLDTVGSPGSYTNALTVASVDNDGFTGAYILQNDHMIFYTETAGYGNEPFAKITGDYEYVYVDGPGVVTDDADNITADQFAAVADKLEGKIGICNRGTSSFFMKANAAAACGAIATVIANNQPGTISMNLSGYEYKAPAVSITKDDGAFLRENADSNETITIGGEEVTVYYGKVSLTGEIAVIEYNAENYTMSDFSSWGVPGDLSLKPEITAPGGNIYSVNGLPAGGTAYENMSGTSMAAPQIAGLVAVMNQFIRENDLTSKTGLTQRQLCNSLLMSTAEPLIEEDSGYFYSVMKQGAGLVDIDAATSAKSYIMMDKSATASASDGKIKVELGDDPERSGAYTATFTMKNMTDKELGINLNADFFTQDIFDYGDMYLDTWTAPLMAAVTWYVDGEAIEALDVSGFDFNGDNAVNAADALILLDYAVGKDVELSNEDQADLDADGDIDTYDAYLALSMINAGPAEIPANGSITVTAEISILNADDYDEKGCYVEGYLFAKEMDEEDGALGVTHSIPVLGYYGSWSEPDMTDVGSALEYAYETESRDPYMYAALDKKALITETYLVRYPGEKKTYMFGGNPYAYDEKYMPERDAMNSKSTLTAFNYSLIRNAAGSRFTVKDADGKDLYQVLEGAKYAAFYYENKSEWYNTSTSLKTNFTPNDNNIAEGTELTLTVEMAPFYYLNDGQINWDALDEGAVLERPLIIDNTAPEIKNVELVKDGSGAVTAIKVTASENEYIATADLYTENSEEIAHFGSDAEAQKGQEYEYTFELGEETPDHLYVFLGDYAANQSVYKINLKEEELSDPVTISVAPETVSIVKNNTAKLTATVTPWGGNDAVTWESSDPDVATVDEAGIVKGLTIGTATITATSVADTTKSATAEVEVIEFNKVLNGVVWDEEGKRFISQFNLGKLPEYTKLSDHLSEAEIASLAVDPYAGVMYGASFDSNEYLSDLYTIDPEDNYKLTKIGSSSICYTDLAIAPGLSADYGKDILVGTYGDYAVFIDAATGDYFTAYQFSGDLVGIAYEGTGKYAEGVYYDWYFFIDVEGNIHETGFIYMNDALYWFKDIVDGNLGYSTETDYFNSAYISFEEDGTENFYWSRFDRNENCVEMIVTEIIYDEENNVSLGEPLSVGTFADEVWPVGGLYEEEPVDEADPGQIVSLDKSGYTPEEAAIAADDIEKIVPDGKAVKGGTNGVKEKDSVEDKAVEKVGKGQPADPQGSGISSVSLEVTADATESEDVIHNGLYEVKWDADLLQLVSWKGCGQYKSDIESPNSLTFGFVDEEGINADDTVLELQFKRMDKNAEAKVVITTLDNGSENPNTKEEFKFSADGGINPNVSVTGITVDPVDASIAIEETLALTATVAPADATDPSVTYTSSDETVASVDENGVVTGLKVGTATITATTKDGGFTAQTEVTVLFKDVMDSAKYWFNPVYWAAKEGITNGYMTPGDKKYGTFGIDENCTREQMVTFLWRQAGKPEPTSTTSTFSDVKSGAYYFKPVLWAAEQGITKGYSSGPNKGKFGVGLTVTREDAMTFLYRMAGKPDVTVSGKPFPDVPTNAYYAKPIVWAVDKGITKGYSSGPNAGKFGVGVNVVRKDVVTFQYRYWQSTQ